MKRYSSAVIFSRDMNHALLIHKLRPSWQLHKANFPGGKVELGDWPANAAKNRKFSGEDHESDCDAAHRTANVREISEETGLLISDQSLKQFCVLRFVDHGEDAECRFYCCTGDIESAKTTEEEKIFVADVDDIIDGSVIDCDAVALQTMGNLPWLTVMARQHMRSENESESGYVINVA